MALNQDNKISQLDLVSSAPAGSMMPIVIGGVTYRIDPNSIVSTSQFVPYTGATANVDLNVYKIINHNGIYSALSFGQQSKLEYFSITFLNGTALSTFNSNSLNFQSPGTGSTTSSLLYNLNGFQQVINSGSVVSFNFPTSKTGSQTFAMLSDITGGGGSGTVTTLSIVSANGFSGTVATATTTPSITLTITDSAVTGKLITGFFASAGTVTSTDTILQAINKIVGNQAKNINSVQSGNGVSLTFSFAHGITGTPKCYGNSAGSLDAAGIKWVSCDATNVTIYYTVAPPVGTNNLIFNVTVK